MKNMRSLLLIAFVILCVIAYMLYRTGSFINTTVDAKALEKEDSLVSQATDPSMTPSSLLFDTFPMPPTTHSQQAAVKQEPNPAEQTTTTNKPISTSLASPDVPKTPTVKPTTTKGETPTDAAEPRFHVIIGSFSNETNAKAKALDFETKNNKKATVIKQGGYFRVCVDKFEFVSSAKIYVQKLKDAGQDFIILKF